MSDIESDTDNEGEFFKLPESFQANNANRARASMNITIPEEESNKVDTSEDDAFSGDEMASRNVAGVEDEMAAQNVAQANVAISQQSPRTDVDSLSGRKAAVDAHNMASKNVAYNGAQLFKWNVETIDGQMVAMQTANIGSGAATTANVHGVSVPSQNREAANNATAEKGVVNDLNKMAGFAGHKMATVNVGGSAKEAKLHGGAVPSQNRETASNATAEKGVVNDLNKMAGVAGHKMATVNGGVFPKEAMVYGGTVAMQDAAAARRATVVKVANYMNQMVAQARAQLVNGGGAAVQAAVNGGGVPSQNAAVAHHATTMKVANYVNQAVARAGNMGDVHGSTNLTQYTYDRPAKTPEEAAARHAKEVKIANYYMKQMVAHAKDVREAKMARRAAAIQAVPPQSEEAARNASAEKVANYVSKLTVHAGDKIAAAAAAKKLAPTPTPTPAPARALVPRRCNIGGCFEVRMGAQRVRWINEGTVIFTTHRTSGPCGYITARRAVVRPPLWRITIQALLFMVFAICLTYFVIYVTDRYLEEDQ